MTHSKTAAPPRGHRAYIGPSRFHSVDNMAAARAAQIAERARREARPEVLPDDRAAWLGVGN